MTTATSIPRIDYLSPLPPRRTGIAEYSVDLLPELSALCDLRVVRLGDDENTPEIEARWRPVPFGALAEGGRLPLYQMGNNQNHVAVYEAAMRQPGVMTLHDLVLHHFHQERLLVDEDFAGYRERLRRDHGWIGEAVAMPIRWTGYSASAVFALPAHRELLLRQRGVLVHSAWSAARIAEEVPAVRVRAVPMGIPLPPPVDPARGVDFRRRHQLPETAPLLGSFGFQTPIKRTEVAIRALAQPQLRTAHLVVVGEAAPVLDLMGEAHEAGVADRVHVLGYVPFDELESAIVATDLCLNLRYPTAGETSASLLRVLALGCPAVVSDYAQFAELPRTLAVKVPLGDAEVEGLASEVGRLLDAPETLLAMGTAARAHVAQEHQPTAAARAVIEACAEWHALDPPVLSLGCEPPVPPASSLTVWPQARIEVDLDPNGLGPWSEGEQRRIAIRVANSGESRCLAADRGPGGLALAVRLDDGATRDLRSAAPWLPLPRDLGPGEELDVGVTLRRPFGCAGLRVELHCMGRELDGTVAALEMALG